MTEQLAKPGLVTKREPHEWLKPGACACNIEGRDYLKRRGFRPTFKILG
jgi:hypothetical protein